MKFPGAYVLPHLVVKFLVTMLSNKEHQLMKLSDDKTFFQNAAASAKAKIGEKFSKAFSKLAQELSEVTSRTQEDGQQAFDPDASNDLMEAYQENASARSVLTAQQTAEEGQVDAEAIAKEAPLDTQIKSLEVGVSVIRSNVENWDKTTKNAAGGGSST